MNLLKNYIPWYIILCTIPIQSKISIPNMQNSVSKLFSRTKQENVIHQEFKDIKTLELLCEQGNISIHTWKQSTTMVELKKLGSVTQLSQTTIDFLPYDDMLQIKTECNDKKNIATIHINIIVPEQTSVKISIKLGNIFIKNLSGEIQANTDSGNINIIDGSQDVSVRSKRGNIMLQRENMIDTEWISAITENGDIIVQIPQHINSKIIAEAKNGKIYSDLLVTLQSKTTKLTDEVYKQQRHQLDGIITKDENAKVAGTIHLETKHGIIKIKNYM